MTTPSEAFNWKRLFQLRSDIGVSLLILPIVAIMILPVPVALLDALLAFNLSVAVWLLMATLFSSGALSLSTFPSLLLFTTMLRLSLNIASTKSILLHADAGNLITSFGELVVGGNLVVGIVVFAIITVVQFVVITKGSERVAEVGARFSLDAMPGKQMAIDADMRAGHLTAEQAQQKREELASESKLHGGMDGAMKFVKGDAIAGLVITCINLLGGMLVGVLYHGMSSSEAANLFAVLSIGDAMVSSIPSLFISLAAGVLITRVDLGGRRRRETLGQQVVSQLTASTTALGSAAGVVLCLAFVPGFPKLPFIGIAAGLGWLAYRTSNVVPEKTDGRRQGPKTYLNDGGDSIADADFDGSPPDTTSGISVRLSRGLARSLGAAQLDRELKSLTPRLQQELGIPFPSLAVWRDEAWAANGFDILVFDVPVARVEVPEECHWAKVDLVEGTADAVAELGWAIKWLPNQQGEQPVRQPEALIAEICLDLVKQRAAKFLGLQEVVTILESANKECPGLVAECQKLVPMQRIAEVLRKLLEEGVPVRNMRTILDALVVWGPREKDAQMLTEYVRQGLGAWLAHQAADDQGSVSVLMFDVELEQLLRQAMRPGLQGNHINLDAQTQSWLEGKLQHVLDTAGERSTTLIASADIRRPVRRLIESRWPLLKVYSYQEIEGHGNLKSLGVISKEGSHE